MDLAVLAAENPEETFAEQIHKALSTSSKSLTPKDLSNLLTKLKESRKIPTFLIDEAKKKWIPSGELRREAIEFLVCQVSCYRLFCFVFTTFVFVSSVLKSYART